MRRVVRTWCGALLFLVVRSTAVAAPPPTLLFSDLTSGPATGNGDISLPGQVAGRDGAIVTVWGRFLGSVRGSSSVTVGDIPANVYSWGAAVAPANLSTRMRMQMVAFQIPHDVPPGATTIRVIVNGVPSNALPFVVRPGAIRFVRTDGDDATGDGSWARPWRTLDNLSGSGALEKISVGDIVYVGNGVTHRVLAGDHAAIDLGPAGTPEAPKAIVGYPGAVASIGDSTLEKAWALWVSGYGPTRHFVIAKLNLTANAVAADLYDGFRLVGNRVTAPEGNGPTGAIAGQGNNLFIFGNELTGIGFAGTSKLYHPIYVQSAEACSGPRRPTEHDREIAWNFLHDNASFDGINLYRECTSSAYMVGHRVHDNWIENQTGCGIRIGDYVTGENWIYNNVVFHAGLGPEPPGDYAMHVPLHIHAGWEGTSTLLHVYNNTIYGGGFTGGQLYSSSVLGFATTHPFALDFRNNILVSTIAGVAYLNPSLDLPPAGGVTRNLWNGAGAAPAWDADPRSGAPLFADAAAGDFRPLPGSPAIGAAIPAVPTAAQPVPETDFFSIPRTSGGGADLGAVESLDPGTSDVPPARTGASLAVSPNPAAGTMTVRLGAVDGVSRLRVVDVVGRTVTSLTPAGPIVRLETAAYSPGVYVVRYRERTVRVAVVR